MIDAPSLRLEAGGWRHLVPKNVCISIRKIVFVVYLLLSSLGQVPKEVCLSIRKYRFRDLVVRAQLLEGGGRSVLLSLLMIITAQPGAQKGVSKYTKVCFSLPTCCSARSASMPKRRQGKGSLVFFTYYC